jgi:hypothetical protein
MLAVKFEPIDRDIELLISDLLSSKAQSKYLADFAIESAANAEESNAAVLGSQVDYTTFVDGIEDASEFDVRPDGTIVYEFNLINETLAYIGQQLEMNSPVLTGRYKASHTLFADGIEVSQGVNIPAATVYTFVSTLPYSRKIEQGESQQAPSGVYEVTANQAQSKFGNVAKINFVDYVGVYGVAAQSPNAKYGRHSTLQHNKAVNRFPAIQVQL